MSSRNMFYSSDKKFSDAEEKMFLRSELVYNVTEDILLALESIGVSKKELANRLGKSRSFVTQTLSGSRNLTLKTLSDVAYALGAKVKVSFEPNNEQSENLFNDNDYFVDKANNIGIIVNPFDTNLDNNIVKVNFACNDHHYENKEQIWYESA